MAQTIIRPRKNKRMLAVELSTSKVWPGETLPATTMRRAPNKAAVASFRGLGLTIISIRVKAKMHRVRIT
jgi:hypothetical protein